MMILHDILGKLKNEFAHSRKGRERGIWFVYPRAHTIVLILDNATYFKAEIVKTWLKEKGCRGLSRACRILLHI